MSTSNSSQVLGQVLTDLADGSARACYAAIGELRPDLVILDIQMPEISGMEALVELKTSHPDLPVLMVSASTVQAAATEARTKGAEGFLLKPYEPADLMRWVTSILDPNHEWAVLRGLDP